MSGDSELFAMECIRRVYWNASWFIANAVILGARAYVYFEEEGMSEAKKFALRGSIISYASIWFLFALATAVLALLSCDLGDAVNSLGVLAAEYVAISLWYHYYGNGDLMQRLVEETRQRMKYLLVQGLGMMDTEQEQYWKQAEAAVVDFWRRKLKEKKWRKLTQDEKDALFFETGVECGKILEKQWEGILYDVQAFYHEWLREVESMPDGQVRMPEFVANSMISGNDTGKQALLCVAIIVANEDKKLRESREANEHRTDHQFCGSRIARRKTAGEGILRWPVVAEGPPRVHVAQMEMDKSGLSIVDGNKEEPCTPDCQLPFSVLYTLKEIINAGYIRLGPDGTVALTVTFKHGNMVIDKNMWNTERTIERKPFRFINSATWMAGDVAFMVEQREITGAAAMLDGSCYLKGTLKIWFKAMEIPEKGSWVFRAKYPKPGKLWGDVSNISEAKSVNPLNLPMMGLLYTTWLLVSCTAKLFKKEPRDPTDPAETAKPISRMGVTNLIASPAEIAKEAGLRNRGTVELNQEFGTIHGDRDKKRGDPQTSTSGEENV